MSRLSGGQNLLMLASVIEGVRHVGRFDLRARAVVQDSSGSSDA
jgi:hypothetical protein